MRSFFTGLSILIALGSPVFAQLTSTNLPIIIINTNIPISGTQIDGTIKVINNMSGVNQPGDPATQNEIIGIKLRGTTSDPKKSYNVETWLNVGGISKNVAMLGMPEENDWVLMAIYPDRSLLRDVTGCYIWEQMGYYSTRMRPVEVIINQGAGDVYVGVYLFGEKIKRDSARVDMAHLLNTDNGGDEITGGYILKIDESSDGAWASNHLPPYASGAQTIEFHYDEPSDGDITSPQIAYIKGWVRGFEDSLASANYQDTTNGWRKYGANSRFRDYLIFNEVIKDNNAYRKNTYMYKDKLKKLRMGPVWGMEQAMYSTGDCNASDPTGFAYMYGQACNSSAYLPPFWWERLMTDTMFNRELKCRYTQLRSSVLDTATIFHYIDSLNTYLNVTQGGGTAQGRNFTKWPIFGVNLVNEPGGGPANYADEISRIKTFIKNRLDWLDTQWSTPGCTLGIAQLLGDEENSYISPNPTTGNFTTHVILTKQTKVGVTVRNIQGAVVYQKNYTLGSGEHQMNHSLENLPSALYIVTVQQDDRSRNFKLVKN
jgi:hypothetical protein